MSFSAASVRRLRRGFSLWDGFPHPTLCKN